MDNKSKLRGTSNMHTAGIYSDMTVDGPEIGTLVLIVDRAKNLPNRKTIGKQNPYCAARLGKEAKKTDTDHRGGQTPKWDQELRYTVHDSPDYYQLKVSVFNDDKKTDLIGETWISLKDVIIHGGGQNDIWHSLNYKGKYAGEIRIEITYYDTRAQQESAKKYEQTEVFKLNTRRTVDPEPDLDDPQRGPRKQPSRKIIKTRPLPLDPVPGNGSASSGGNSNSFSSQYASSFNTANDFELTILQHNRIHAFEPSDHIGPSSNTFSRKSSTLTEYDKTSSHSHRNSSSINTSDYSYMNPQRGHRSSKSRSAESIASTIEYNKKTYVPYSSAFSGCKQNLFHNLHDSYSNKSSSRSRLPQNNQYESPDWQPCLFANEEFTTLQDQYTPRNIPHDNQYNKPAIKAHGTSQPYDGTPPPPPIHRSRNLSQSPMHQSISSCQDPHKQTPDQSPSYNASSINEGRNSLSKCKRRTSYTAYIGEKYPVNHQYSLSEYYPESVHHTKTFDAQNQDGRFVQNAYDDKSSFPVDGEYHHRHRKNEPEHKEKDHSYFTNSLPQTTTSQIFESSRRNNLSSNFPQRYLEGQSESPCSFSASEISLNNRSAQFSNSSRSDSDSAIHQDMIKTAHSRSHSRSTGNRRHSIVPINLVPGISQQMPEDFRNRITEENQLGMGIFYQKTNENGLLPQKIPVRTLPYREPIVPHTERHGIYSNNTSTTSLDSHSTNIRKDVRSSTIRKSVSPSSTRPENQRRNSYVPYGPESYNNLNPSLNSACNFSYGAPYDLKSVSDSKIITHDGREVDPIDHIPESNYATLYENRNSKNVSQMPGQDHEPMSNAQISSSTIGPRPPRHLSRPTSAYEIGNKMLTHRHSNSFESSLCLSDQHNPRSKHSSKSTDFMIDLCSPNHKNTYKDPYIPQPNYTSQLKSKGVSKPKIPNNYMLKEFYPSRNNLIGYYDSHNSNNMLPISLTAAYKSSEPLRQAIDERPVLY